MEEIAFEDPQRCTVLKFLFVYPFGHGLSVPQIVFFFALEGITHSEGSILELLHAFNEGLRFGVKSYHFFAFLSRSVDSFNFLVFALQGVVAGFAVSNGPLAIGS